MFMQHKQRSEDAWGGGGRTILVVGLGGPSSILIFFSSLYHFFLIRITIFTKNLHKTEKPQNQSTFSGPADLFLS